MNILKQELSKDGRTGRIIADELPSDIQHGDVIVETFPGQCFVEKIPTDPDVLIPALEQIIREKDAEIQSDAILSTDHIG